MGEHQRRRRRRRRGSGEDHISSLPDALLHEILVRLRSADAAARTSVLSRRWRHVWAHLPELRVVVPGEAAPASFFDTVDAALGSYLAPTLEHLGVSHSNGNRFLDDLRIPPRRIAPWLNFAAEHVVGELNLYLSVPQCYVVSTPEVVGEEAVLEFPIHSCLLSCPCRLEESRKIDGIDLSSLEEVQISGFSGSDEQMELVEILSSNATILKRLLINDELCRRPKEAREKVRSMCHPNVKVEFFVFCEGRQVLVE